MVKNRFDTILQVAEAKENSAAQEFADARKHHEFNQEKLQELRQFRDGYSSDSSQGTQHARAFQSTRKFLSQLCDVIEQQEGEVERTLEAMNHRKHHWLNQRMKRRSVEKLKDKRLAEAEHEQQKREQKELDEMSSLSPNRY